MTTKVTVSVPHGRVRVIVSEHNGEDNVGVENVELNAPAEREFYVYDNRMITIVEEKVDD